MRFEASLNQKPEHRMTFGEVYMEYCEQGRSGKAYSTIKKQNSLWKKHLEEKFGSRYVDSISVAEINDYLSFLYLGSRHKYGRIFLWSLIRILTGDVPAIMFRCRWRQRKQDVPGLRLMKIRNWAFGQRRTECLITLLQGTNGETVYSL